MKITVLRQSGMPSFGSCDCVLKKLEAFATLRFVEAQTLVQEGIDGDYFYNAHGEYYPLEIEDTLFDFLAQGGGLLHIGGMPFEKAMVLELSLIHI